MTKYEMRELWAYLRNFFPKAKQLLDRNIGNAWYEVLQPYPADAVKEAFMAYLRQGKNFFPDIAEITSLLPQQPAPVKVSRDATKPGENPYRRVILRLDAKMAELGYPPLAEWLEQGRPASDWWRARGQCQLNDPEWLGLLTPEQGEMLREYVHGGKGNEPQEKAAAH